MKLLLCPVCHDVRKLLSEKTLCVCGSSWGRYLTDGLHAEIGGQAIPLGFTNSSLVNAVRNRPKQGMGADFTAFVIPNECDTIRIIE